MGDAKEAPTTPVKISPATVDATKGTPKFAFPPYEFPIFPIPSHVQTTDASLIEADLEQLVKPLNPDGSKREYWSVRREICEANILLNMIGRRPPSFRSRRRLPPDAFDNGPSVDESLFNNDRQVLDLHWLYCGAKTDKLGKGEFERLFVNAEFDFELAARFATYNPEGKSKVDDVLALSDVEQLQMTSLRNTRMNDHFNRCEVHRAKAEVHLRRMANRDSAITPRIQDWQALWSAHQFGKGCPQHVIGQIHGWILGKPPLGKSTLSTKLKMLNRLLAESMQQKG